MANSKLINLTNDASPSSTDIGYTVKDPGGTPLDRKATWLSILSGASLGLLTSDGDIFTRAAGAAARITRANLAADSAFTSAFPPIAARVCKVYRSAALTLTNNSAVAIAWDAEELDPNGWHDNSTNPSRITPNIAGKYRVSAVWRSSDAFADQKQAVLALRKNGSDLRGGTDERWTSGTTGKPAPRASTVADMNGSTDYFEAVYFQLNGSDRSLDTTVSAFEAEWIGT